MTTDPKLIDMDGDIEDVFNHDDILSTPIDKTLEAIDLWMEDEDKEHALKIRVYRETSSETQPRGNTAQPFLFSILPTEMEPDELLEHLRDNYGSGGYWIKGYGPKSRLVFNRHISVEDTEGDKRRALEKKIALNPSLAPPQNDMMKMMMDMQQKSEARILSVINAMVSTQQPVTPVVDPMTMMTTLMRAMSEMKALTSDGSTKNTGMEQLELIQKGVEFARDLNPSDKETNDNDIIVTLIKNLGGPMLEAMKKPPQTPAVIEQPIEGAKKPITQQPPADPQVNAYRQLMMQQTAFLLSVAKNNGNPEIYADMLLDQMPNITQLLQGQSIGDVCAGLNPEVNLYKPWFDQLNAALYEDGAPAEDDLTRAANEEQTSEIQDDLESHTIDEFVDSTGDEPTD